MILDIIGQCINTVCRWERRAQIGWAVVRAVATYIAEIGRD